MNFMERLTDAEEKIRDRALKPALDLLIPRWISPDHITATRAFLVLLAIILYLLNLSLAVQIWILATAALTDLVDGPLARLRGQCSRRGAYLDQASDWLLGSWMGTLVLLTGLLSSTLIILMVVPQIGLLVMDRIRASRLSSSNMGERALTIAMGAANFRPTTVARLQFVAVLLGFMLILLSRTTRKAVFYWIGLSSLILEISLACLLLVHGAVKATASDR